MGKGKSVINNHAKSLSLSVNLHIMKDFSLFALSPVDGRYQNYTASLAGYFSEAALIRYRVFVEVEYFLALAALPLPQMKDMPDEGKMMMLAVAENFSDNDAVRVKEIEKEINHDVKAVEYFIKEKIQNTSLAPWSEFVHFGLTSQDINNTAVPLSVKAAVQQEMIPLMEELTGRLIRMADDMVDIPMLAHTHGQPASPTSLGKEIYVFAERMQQQITLLKQIPFNGKFGGATGNFNAHVVAYPGIDWVDFGNDFLQKKLGLSRQAVTTQIEHYDNLAALFHAFMRINNVMLDLARDFWTYISMHYFGQKIVKGEVGSSAMPHKVNPIDFENAEGNIGIANALFGHLAAKLPVSRLQRDLTDSTVSRNIGVPFAHAMIAYRSLLRGLGKVKVNTETIDADLEENWAVIAEAIQTILRREGVDTPYEKLKQLTRTGEKITKTTLQQFINTLDVTKAVKEEMLRITPQNYRGYSHQQVINRTR